MAWLDKDVQSREQGRYYLFAGMGGRAARRRRRKILLATLVGALCVSIGLAVLFYLINKPI